MLDLSIVLKEDDMSQGLSLLPEALREELVQKLEEAVRILIDAATTAGGG